MVTCPLNFHTPTLSDADSVRRCTQNVLQSDLSFVNLYLLYRKYGTEILLHMEHLIRRFTGDGRLRGYTFPVGGKDEDIIPCLHVIEADARYRRVPLQYCLLTEKQASFLHDLYGEKIVLRQDDGDSDYLYNREQLATLPGTLFHKKRTHINAFLRKNSDAKFVKLSPGNQADALAVASEWMKMQEDSPALRHEFRAIENALLHREQLQIDGGIVYCDGKPIAMALYSLINADVADIHYEKCIPEYRDAYAFINREIAATTHTQWVNREEDLNIEGLRKAKLSYHPALILKKYSATVYVD